jgi:hypothetical protein
VALPTQAVATNSKSWITLPKGASRMGDGHLGMEEKGLEMS